MPEFLPSIHRVWCKLIHGFDNMPLRWHPLSTSRQFPRRQTQILPTLSGAPPRTFCVEWLEARNTDIEGNNWPLTQPSMNSAKRICCNRRKLLSTAPRRSCTPVNLHSHGPYNLLPLTHTDSNLHMDPVQQSEAVHFLMQHWHEVRATAED